MRARTFALVGLMLGVGVTVSAADVPKVEYQQFASSAGKYKVLFPGPVKTETTQVKTPVDTRTLTLDSVSLPGGVLFVVTFIDVPEDAAKAPAGPRLDKIRDANKGTDGQVLSEKNLEIGPDKLPGRDVVIQKPGTALRNRVIISGQRLYQVMLQGSREFVTSQTADRFFDSFEVTK